MGLTYRKGDLFSLLPEKDFIIAHSVNAMGVWGSGFAGQLKDKYPLAFAEYSKEAQKATVLGKCHTTDLGTIEITGMIANLFVSAGYGKFKSPPNMILEFSVSSILQLLQWNRHYNFPIYSPKINSGLFEVPWEQTEEIIKLLLKFFPNQEWNICEPSERVEI